MIDYNLACHFCYLLLGRVGVASIAHEIYSIGGYDGLSNLSSVEIYDLDKEEWVAGQPMHMHQGGVGVAVISLD